MKKYVCCFCGETFYDYGNNPAPVNNEAGARCCDDCNSSVVIPARIEAYMRSKISEYDSLFGQNRTND